MEKFEYKTHTFSLKFSIFNKPDRLGSVLPDELNELGKDGWQLVSDFGVTRDSWTKSITFVFMRKKVNK